MSSTLTSMLAAHADDAPAIGASEKSWLTYGALRSLSHEVRTSLRTNGIGAKDRVAIVLPNGAAMASAFITIAQAATTAPLNPNYREANLPFIWRI